MKPIKFDGANVVFGEKQKEYQPLPAQIYHNPNGQIVTKWELSPEEINTLKETGCIYLSVLTFGNQLQPVLLSVDHPGIIDINN